jgi:hypothetical protein
MELRVISIDFGKRAFQERGRNSLHLERSFGAKNQRGLPNLRAKALFEPSGIERVTCKL